MIAANHERRVMDDGINAGQQVPIAIEVPVPVDTSREARLFEAGSKDRQLAGAHYRIAGWHSCFRQIDHHVAWLMCAARQVLAELFRSTGRVLFTQQHQRARFITTFFEADTGLVVIDGKLIKKSVLRGVDEDPCSILDWTAVTAGIGPAMRSRLL